jgi:hypothetical protein
VLLAQFSFVLVCFCFLLLCLCFVVVRYFHFINIFSEVHLRFLPPAAKGSFTGWGKTPQMHFGENINKMKVTNNNKAQT